MVAEEAAATHVVLPSPEEVTGKCRNVRTTQNNTIGAKALSEARFPVREGVFGPRQQRTYQGGGLRGDAKP